MLDLKQEYDSYLFGFILADGSLYFGSRNRGKVAIELSIKDEDIITKINENFYWSSTIGYRTRNTNFKTNAQFVSWKCCARDFREGLVELGMPNSNKTRLARPPVGEYNKSAFWRGVIDGDGSVGITKENKPFISLTTYSEDLKSAFLLLLEEEFNIYKNIKRNTRDNIYNITVYNEDALLLGDYLYNSATIFLDRKYAAYKANQSWVRTKKKVNQRAWTKEEDLVVLTHNVQTSMQLLNRTESSVRNRRYRLRQKHAIIKE